MRKWSEFFWSMILDVHHRFLRGVLNLWKHIIADAWKGFDTENFNYRVLKHYLHHYEIMTSSETVYMPEFSESCIKIIVFVNNSQYNLRGYLLAGYQLVALPKSLSENFIAQPSHIITTIITVSHSDQVFHSFSRSWHVLLMLGNKACQAS